MRAREATAHLALLLALATPAWAAPARAGTLTVGPAGSGAAFADIQPAVDAAQPGDVILVAPGTYGRFTVTRALSVVAEVPGTARIEVTVPAGGGETHLGALVTGLASGEEVLLSGLVFETQVDLLLTGAAPPCLRITNCTGNVLLHELDLQPGLAPAGFLIATGPTLFVEFSDLVVLTDSVVRGGRALAVPPQPAIAADHSGLWLSTSHVEGVGAQLWPNSPAPGVGIEALDSVLYLAETSVRGGDGRHNVGLCPGGLPGSIDLLGQYGASALVAFGASDLKLAGGPGSQFAPGLDALSPECTLGAPGFGLELYGGSDALVPDRAGVVSQAVYQFASITTTSDRYPTLALAPPSVAPGGSSQLQLSGTGGALQFAFFGLATIEPLTLAGLDGALWISPAASFLVGGATLTQDHLGAALAFGIPPDPVLVGLDLPFQAVELAGSAIALSGPALLVVRP